MITKEDFLAEMKDLLDTEETVEMDSKLSEFEDWDSLCFVSFLATMSEYTSQKLQTKQVRDAETIADLYDLLGV